MPLIAGRAAQHMNTAGYFVFALILMAIGAGFIWAGQAAAPSDDADAKVFASDPSCAVSLGRDLPTGACQTVDGKVIGAEVRYHGIGRTRAHDDLVTVQLTDGTIHEEAMYGSTGGLFVYAVKAGDPARVQRFHGEIVRILADGLTVEMMSAPDVSATADSQMPWAGAGLIVVGLLFAVFGVREARRAPQPVTN